MTCSRRGHGLENKYIWLARGQRPSRHAARPCHEVPTASGWIARPTRTAQWASVLQRMSCLTSCNVEEQHMCCDTDKMSCCDTDKRVVVAHSVTLNHRCQSSTNFPEEGKQQGSERDDPVREEVRVELITSHGVILPSSHQGTTSCEGKELHERQARESIPFRQLCAATRRTIDWPRDEVFKQQPCHVISPCHQTPIKTNVAKTRFRVDPCCQPYPATRYCRIASRENARHDSYKLFMESRGGCLETETRAFSRWKRREYHYTGFGLRGTFEEGGGGVKKGVLGMNKIATRSIYEFLPPPLLDGAGSDVTAPETRAPQLKCEETRERSALALCGHSGVRKKSPAPDASTTCNPGRRRITRDASGKKNNPPLLQRRHEQGGTIVNPALRELQLHAGQQNYVTGRQRVRTPIANQRRLGTALQYTTLHYTALQRPRLKRKPMNIVAPQDYGMEMPSRQAAVEASRGAGLGHDRGSRHGVSTAEFGRGCVAVGRGAIRATGQLPQGYGQAEVTCSLTLATDAVGGNSPSVHVARRLTQYTANGLWMFGVNNTNHSECTITEQLKNTEEKLPLVQRTRAAHVIKMASRTIDTVEVSFANHRHGKSRAWRHLVQLESFSSMRYSDEMHSSDKGDTARFVKCAIATKRKALNWHATPTDSMREHSEYTCLCSRAFAISQRDEQKEQKREHERALSGPIETRLLTIPHSSAQAKRIFSIVTDVRYKKSTILSTDMLKSVCVIRNNFQFKLASGNCAGRCRWSAGFLGDVPLPKPIHSGVAPYSLQSTSSVLKTSLLRAAKISLQFKQMKSSDFVVSDTRTSVLSSYRQVYNSWEDVDREEDANNECRNTTETLPALRVGAMRHLACVIVSPVSLPRFLTLDAQLFTTPLKDPLYAKENTEPQRIPSSFGFREGTKPRLQKAFFPAVPAYLELFPAFETEKCGSDKDATATRIKYAIASKRKALN
ncbi:hypothetical protein PR048_013783 [Dryococelus australis]|uniref:Uncharacterized protein n=1 Tax=Dryococelus australis TaxID=614101 RepID=A0ABQ9HT46_9NEOP|nr:hypothetical protein PR048_013783 [Dryococelus australis]